MSLDLTFKITNIRARWNEEYSNRPDFECDVDSSFTDLYETMRFEKRGSLYFGEQAGIVRFFSYDDPSDGFGGAYFPIRMKDTEEEVTLIGPWSSRSGCMNKAGFTPCTEITFCRKFGKDKYVSRSTGAITIALLKQLLAAQDSPLNIIEIIDPSGEITYEPMDHTTHLPKGVDSRGVKNALSGCIWRSIHPGISTWHCGVYSLVTSDIEQAWSSMEVAAAQYRKGPLHE